MKKDFIKKKRLVEGVELISYAFVVLCLLGGIMVVMDLILPIIFDSLNYAIKTDDAAEWNRYLVLLILALAGLIMTIVVSGRFLVQFTQEMQVLINGPTVSHHSVPRSNESTSGSQTVPPVMSLYAECHSCNLYKVCRYSNSTYEQMLDQAGLTEAIDAFRYNQTHLVEVCRSGVTENCTKNTEVYDCMVQTALEYGYQLGQTEGITIGFRRGVRRTETRIRAELDDN